MSDELKQELLELGSWLRHEQKRRFPVTEDSDEGATLFVEFHDGKVIILNALPATEEADFFPAW